MVVVERDVVFVFARCEEFCASTMPSTSFIFRHHTVARYDSFAHSFNFFCFRLSISTICAPAAAAFSFFACAFIPSLSACAAAFFVAAVSFFIISMISWYFFELRLFDFNVFLLGRVPHTQSCRVFSCVLVVDVVSKHDDRESSHDTSVVTSHVDHVVGLGVFIVSQVSSLGQYVVNLFFFSYWRSEGRLFLKCLSVHRVEGGVIL